MRRIHGSKGLWSGKQWQEVAVASSLRAPSETLARTKFYAAVVKRIMREMFW